MGTLWRQGYCRSGTGQRVVLQKYSLYAKVGSWRTIRKLVINKNFHALSQYCFASGCPFLVYERCTITKKREKVELVKREAKGTHLWANAWWLHLEMLCLPSRPRGHRVSIIRRSLWSGTDTRTQLYSSIRQAFQTTFVKFAITNDESSEFVPRYRLKTGLIHWFCGAFDSSGCKSLKHAS